MTLRVAGAQIGFTVGDLAGNEERIRDAMSWAEAERADVLLLPELAVTGYPPEDLVMRRGFVEANLAVVARLAAASGNTATVVGFVDRLDAPQLDDDSMHRHIANAAAVLHGGEMVGVYRKRLLPNYGVFDEARHFAEGTSEVRLWEVGGVVAGVSICEDMWSRSGPPARQAAAGARVLLNINGSPYHVGKGEERAELLRSQAVAAGVPVVYVNTVGGQDELVFDGDSMIFAGDGSLVFRAGQFVEERFVVDVPLGDVGRSITAPRMGREEEIYTALTVGMRDYVRKNGFHGVVVGMSGGIDSALTAAIAVDALGAENVWGVTMPTRYSSSGSVDDSIALARNLGFRIDTIPIENVFAAFLADLAPVFAGTEHGVAEENIQARIRGTLLMAISNKFGNMVVATGNKSEMAVGYATLYGDMVGGYAVLKDVYKTTVYRLARWRNRDGEVIPQAVIDKPPSAELRPNQRDSDALPPYDLLDDILFRYIEQDRSAAEIIGEGFDERVVREVTRMVDRNEYKRRQAAPGVKITEKAFGRDRRLPITNRWTG